MKRLSWLVVLVVLAMFVGCKAEAPATPDKVVTEAAAALKSGELSKVWVMLPESWQKDVQEIYTKAFGIVDKDLYNSAFGLLGKALAAANKQKDKIKAQVPDVDKYLPVAEEFVKLLGELKLNDYDSAKAIMVADLIGSNGKKVADFGWKVAGLIDPKKAEEAKKTLGGITAEAKDVKENEAMVVVKIDGKEMPAEKFVKVEGKWVPEMLVKQWPEMKKGMLAQIDGAAAFVKGQGEAIKGQLKGVEAAIAGFEQTGDLGSLMMLGMMMGGAPAPEEAPAAPPAEEPKKEEAAPAAPAVQ